MTVQPQRAMTASEWSLLLLLSLLWGGSFFFIGVAVKALPPLVIVEARLAVAAVALWLVAPFTGLSPSRLWAQAPGLALLGLINNVIPFSLIVWSQTHIPIGLASILNATTPVFTIVAAHFFTADERLNPRRLVGALIGFAGVAAMIGPDLFSGFGGNLAAEGAGLLAAIAYALAIIFARRFPRRGLAPIEVATGQVTASSLMLAPVVLFLNPPWTLPAPSGSVLAALIAIGALSTALAFVVYFRILAGAGATNVVLVTLLAPATAMLLGAAVLSERLGPAHFLGLAMIALGLACIDGRPLRAAQAYFVPSTRRSEKRDALRLPNSGDAR